MDKEHMVYIHNGILLSQKKEWNNAIRSNMDGLRDCNTEWTKSNKGKYCLYVESKKKKKKDTNELIYRTEIELQMWEIHLWLPGRKEEEG